MCKLRGVEDGKGDYLVLSDYGAYEGIDVSSQHQTLDAAVEAIQDKAYGAAVVKICHFEVREV